MEDKIRALVASGKLTFKDARKGRIATGDYGTCVNLAVKLAKESGQPLNQCWSQVCTIYWRLFDET